MTTKAQHPLEKILESRIAIIDGAMGDDDFGRMG